MNPQEKQEALEALQKRSEFENKLVVKAYEDEAFRQQLIADPKKIYEQELGTNIPDSINIQVVEEQPNTIYMILPRKAEEAGAEGELSDEALEAVAGGGWVAGSRRSWVLVTN
jgi:hypothetical protein